MSEWKMLYNNKFNRSTPMTAAATMVAAEAATTANVYIDDCTIQNGFNIKLKRQQTHDS